MLKSTMWSVFKPRSTRLTLNRLFANRPAGTSSAIDIAICTVASVVRKRRAAFAPPGCPAWFFSVAARSGRVLCSAGNKPNAMPVTIAAPPANISIVGLSENANIGRLFRGHDRRDHIERPLRDEQAGDRAERGEHDRLGEQLRDQLAAVRADRQPHRHFRGAAGAAHEQQVGNVGARDQQHRAGDDEQDRQRRARFVRRSCSGRGGPARVGDLFLDLEARHRLLAHPLLQRRFDVVEDRAIRTVDRDGGLFASTRPASRGRTHTPSTAGGSRSR